MTADRPLREWLRERPPPGYDRRRANTRARSRRFHDGPCPRCGMLVEVTVDMRGPSVTRTVREAVSGAAHYCPAPIRPVIEREVPVLSICPRCGGQVAAFRSTGAVLDLEGMSRLGSGGLHNCRRIDEPSSVRASAGPGGGHAPPRPPAAGSTVSGPRRDGALVDPPSPTPKAAAAPPPASKPALPTPRAIVAPTRPAGSLLDVLAVSIEQTASPRRSEMILESEQDRHSAFWSDDPPPEAYSDSEPEEYP